MAGGASSVAPLCEQRSNRRGPTRHLRSVIVGVRQAAVGEEPLVRALRIAALSDAPKAFATTVERERARTLDEWRRWFAPGITHLYVDDSGQGVGTAAGLVDEDRSLGRGCQPSPSAPRCGRQRACGVALYERHGFRRTGDVTVRADGLREVVMDRVALVVAD